mmetsp:Transcript_20519/g.70456  ORF Transcript_20519/g.70456 Transcript_20519/m.70456 type:complete len:317 (+) Transcript_20519:1426-2376(+)
MLAAAAIVTSDTATSTVGWCAAGGRCTGAGRCGAAGAAAGGNSSMERRLLPASMGGKVLPASSLRRRGGRGADLLRRRHARWMTEACGAFSSSCDAALGSAAAGARGFETRLRALAALRRPTSACITFNLSCSSCCGVGLSCKGGRERSGETRAGPCDARRRDGLRRTGCADAEASDAADADASEAAPDSSLASSAPPSSLASSAAASSSLASSAAPSAAPSVAAPSLPAQASSGGGGGEFESVSFAGAAGSVSSKSTSSSSKSKPRLLEEVGSTSKRSLAFLLTKGSRRRRLADGRWQGRLQSIFDSKSRISAEH